MQLAGHTVKAYDQQLESLLELIQQMGGRVHALMQLCKRAMQERSEALLEEARRQDKEINRLEQELEDAAIATLALQNPMAVDLRFVTSALKISGMLERAGDLAKNTVKRSMQLGEDPSSETLAKLGRMADIILSMLDEALLAVRERNAAGALEVWRQDDEVDALYHDIFATIQEQMHAGTSAVTVGTHVVFMAKNLERIADYVTNLAKTVHYVVTGAPPDKSLIREAKAPN